MSALEDLDQLARNQRDELRGTVAGRRVTTAPLTPERDAIIHRKLQYLAKTGIYPSDEQLEAWTK